MGATPSVSTAAEARRRARSFIALPCLRAVIDKDAQGCTIEIIELPARRRPEECRKPEQAKQQRYRDEDGNDAHRAARLRRNAFTTTRIDEHDMASAATRGVTWPAIARGTASRL